MSLKKQLNAIYKVEFPWMGEVHRDAHSQPFANLQKAMQSFFSKKAKHPTFKCKGKCKDKFYVANDKFHIEDKVVILPKIGKVKMTEELRFQGKILAATVSRSADRWFISIQVECEPVLKQKTGNLNLGIDLGVKTSITCSDGSIYQSPKPLKQKLKKIKLLSRSVSRKVKGSKNRAKAIEKLSKQHWKVANVRNDFLHKTTTDIVRKSQAVCIEDLSVKGMLSNHKLARAIAEQGLRNFRVLLEYKCPVYDTYLQVEDRWFASSKTCCVCGHVKEDLKLSDRVYKCESCGNEKDRDLNASINLENKLPSARGEEKPVDQRKNQILGFGVGKKQEFNFAHLCVERK